MYFQPEVDCYSREANKNKYKHVQLIASKKKKNLKIVADFFVAWISKYFVAWACCCLKVYL